MPDVSNFLPSKRGFNFINSWPPIPDKKIPTPFGDIAIGAASNGLCGGMVFAIRDYFEANITQPSGPQPTEGQPLFDYIVDRLFASFDLPNGPTKYYDWMTTSDHDTFFKTGLAHRTIIDEWPKIKDDLDNNRLSCLALVTLFSLNPGDMGHNHQVLAYGYDIDTNNILTLKVYDPNSLLADNTRISLSLDNPSQTTPISHNVDVSSPIRGFFHMPYTWVSPPQFDDIAPQSMSAGSVSLVTLRVKNTGTTTWPLGDPAPYRLGSQRPQDNTTWGTARVELPHTVNPTQPVDFTFNVTAPMLQGQQSVLMGWRMVREMVHWFGELEERSVSIIGPPKPVDACEQLRNEILGADDEIGFLQAELKEAAGQQKAFITAQIRRLRAEQRKLRDEATTRGCSNIP